ncbi:ATP-binding cassette domain-containing protein [Streptantibioticus silvisoli]|uniref:ATP-binding cassette domain-containing protein n=1 Tax=Streptantibioticus silvisoli TaxID=2705255 RepID=A0ABT6VV06_9ACTN|nr:ATP-binding cassette domain-containing protein [Streptantibioticus silvisoli]MDI5962308.1 ATP-binding cassette domain-containing protein [Streptantibioticus silvisoli]
MTERPTRVFPTFLGFSFRADRGGAWATLIMFTFRPLAAVLFSLGLAAMLAALLQRHFATAVAVACAACVMLVVQVASAKTALSVSARMVDRTGRLVDREIQRMLHGAPTLEHFHDPVLLDKLEVIRAERPRLTEGADVSGLILGTSLRLACVVVVAALATPWLLLVPVAAVVSYACTAAAERARHRGRTASAEAARLRADFFTIGTDPAHRDELLLAGAGEFARARHAAWAREAERTRARGMWLGLLWAALGVLIMTAAFGVGFLFLVSSLLHGTTAVGTALAALLMLSNVTVLMSGLIRYLSALSDSMRATGLLLEVREALGAHRAPGPAAVAGREVRGIELNGVGFRYPAGHAAVLDAVDLTLRPGTVYALVGANGSGKSTLVQVLAGLLPPTTGSVRRGGPAGDRTSLVAQDYVRFEFELEDSVRLGDDGPGAGDLARALSDSGLDAYLARGELALRTPLGRSLPTGTDLSGGQWQRVAICRGLLSPETTLLLLDEPTSAIDPLAEDALLSTFAAWSHAVAQTTDGVAVIVTHRMSLVREVDEVILMSGGRIVAVAPHEDLLGHPEYQKLYHVQQRAYAETASGEGEEDWETS